MQQPEPALPLTVPRSLWDAVAEAVRPTYADSYLSGAEVKGETLWPHTTIAYDRLMKEPFAVKAITDLGLRLVRPLPFADPRRPNGAAERKRWDEMMRPKRK